MKMQDHILLTHKYSDKKIATGYSGNCACGFSTNQSEIKRMPMIELKHHWEKFCKITVEDV